MTHGAPCDRGDAGFTLVEVLLAVAILGISVVTVIGGMMTLITVTHQDRGKADGQIAIRRYADFVMDQPYVACPASAAYGNGYTDNGWIPTAPDVTYWRPTGSGRTGTFGACPTTDTGIQRVTLTVASIDDPGTTLTLVVVKRRAS
jgi:prepilin-type N-terminal cleavage/methylation domain-containing protein